jgi:zinc/manganese transport system substrate-binding protein
MRQSFRFFLLSVLVVFNVSLAQAQPLQVVASFSILGDLTQQIGGERVRVHTLVGPDADAHVYQPTPADSRQLAGANLVIVNGLGFEGWFDRLVRASGYRGSVVIASKDVVARNEDGQPAKKGDALDPHAWQDPRLVQRYVANITAGLISADPAGRAVYAANAARLDDELVRLDAAVRDVVSRLPAGSRTVVTSHDAFGYFSAAYGLRFVAPSGVATEAEPSAAQVARLIRQIRQEKIPALFMENITDPRLLERIRSETVARIGGTLYSDALSKADGPASSYLSMMRHNVRTLITALAPDVELKGLK